MRVPIATYRLQLNGDFTFEQTKRVVGYLAALGVSDLYCSPILKARRGSRHCYDVVDHDSINPELGGERGLDGLSAELGRHGLGMLLDVVPNHMAASDENRLWMDVLENGPRSRYASYFDIDWRSGMPGLRDKVLLPVLGREPAQAVRSGDILLRFEMETGEPHLLLYGSSRLPLSHRSYATALRRLSTGVTGEPRSELDALVSEAERSSDPGPGLKERLARVWARHPALAEVAGSVTLASTPEILSEQFYVVARWDEAARRLNYRRFLTVSDLVAIRVERPEVFLGSHRLILELLSWPTVTGLRVDHADGLSDPDQYFRRLQRSAPASGRRGARGRDGKRVYLLAEKITRPGGSLPPRWSVHGSTGYDFANDVNGLFVRKENREEFQRIYTDFIGESLDFEEVCISARELILRSRMVSELRALAAEMSRASRSMAGEAVSPSRCSGTLGSVIACLPVYRTYVSPRSRAVSEATRNAVRMAVEAARDRDERVDDRTVALIETAFGLGSGGKGHASGPLRSFVARFQQLTEAVAVKGIEDTAFYRFNRLASLNEVGGDPVSFGVSAEEFHARNLARSLSWPSAMVATSTHDTKRSEDVRARIDVLSEVPREWESSLAVWRWRKAADEDPPSRNDEYLFYQTLLGVWPLERMGREALGELTERLVSYMRKASKEAKSNTSWVEPDLAYDRALEGFVRATMAAAPIEDRLPGFTALSRKVSYFGMLNSLSQVLLKATSPGMPDFYQGSELWDLSLVDPDNRRPVDFGRRRSALRRIARSLGADGTAPAPLARRALATWRTGEVKLLVTHLALRSRTAHARLFAQGGYAPLEVVGPLREHVCAFMRVLGRERCIVAVPLQVANLTQAGVPPVGRRLWEGTEILLPQGVGRGAYRDALTGHAAQPAGVRRTIGVGELFSTLPLALLFGPVPAIASAGRREPARRTGRA